MKFSVVVVTYNRARKLKMCLEAFEKQTYPEFEIIVVDDGSTDETRDVATQYPFVRYAFQPHRGTAALLNVGWRLAEGELVLMTDDDCVGPSNWLATLWDGFRRYPAVVAVGSFAAPPNGLASVNRFARFDEWEFRSHGGLAEEYLGGAETPTAGLVAYKRDVLEEVNGFREDLIMAGAHDHDLKLQLTALGYEYLFIPLKIDHYRDYDSKSFRRQHIGRGRALVRYQISVGGNIPSRSQVLGRLLKRTGEIPKRVVTTRDLALAFTIFQSGVYNCVGQWKELSHKQS